jgi:hypothetical protein
LGDLEDISWEWFVRFDRHLFLFLFIFYLTLNHN